MAISARRKRRRRKAALGEAESGGGDDDEESLRITVEMEKAGHRQVMQRRRKWTIRTELLTER